jgi:hypothetical protein
VGGISREFLVFGGGRFTEVEIVELDFGGVVGK